MPRRLACRFTTGAIRVGPDRRHVTLPRLGTIRTHENTRKLQRRIGNGTARILSATVRQERGRWLVSFQVEVKREIIRVSRPGVAVGVDLGVKVLAVMADSAGEIRYVPNPAHYDTALKALRRLSRRVSRRRGPDQRTGQQPSKRWLAADAERNRVHHRVANLRADALHKLTTGLARKIADAGFGEIRRQITYKAGWDSGTVIVANRWYPSSRACSFCGARSGRRPGRTSAETAWSRPEDPRQPGQPQGRSRAGR
ncbi:putative transposase [Nonomuraea wenchangensis]|uniref:Putative transposase n=1 Tax=Nonomuraea wenchangensis TaxID=568860 RepID=A0A1I0KCG6_9ACTN|nr:putative transposase [Nonomuraea wenchangensis]